LAAGVKPGKRLLSKGDSGSAIVEREGPFMKPGVVKLRGRIVMGAAWAILWAATFGLAALAIGMFDPASMDPGETPLVIAAIGGAVGFVFGAGFAMALSIAEPGSAHA
jgi:hypothetical protein